MSDELHSDRAPEVVGDITREAAGRNHQGE